MAYCISHPKLMLEIRLEEISKLHIHEQIIPEAVERLSKDISQERQVKHPVIVDKKTLVVLDGMHRVAALQRLGYRLIPVCLVDYDNANIRLEGWFRTISLEIKTNRDIGEVLEEEGYDLQDAACNDLERSVHEKKIALGILTTKKCHNIRTNTDGIKETYELIRQIERSLKSAGYKIAYETEKDAMTKVKSGQALAAIIAPRIMKKDVVDVAVRGQVFVQKATRHVIPARPLFVNVPTEWLNMNSEAANNRLYDYMSKKKIKHYPPGQTIDRRYEEELYVFSDR